MKKYKNLIISACIVIMLLVSIPNFAFASETTINKDTIQASNENSSQIISSFGYDESQFKYLSMEDRLVIAKALLINPSIVKSQKMIVHFNELSLLEDFVNSSDEELISFGMNMDEVEETRKKINEIATMENADIMAKYNKTFMEAKLLKESITPQEKYFVKPIEGNAVSSSGTAGDSNLQISNWVTDISSPECGAVAYKVINTFEWIDGFVWHGTDEMITCWGGNLNSKGEVGTASYTNGFPVENWTTTSKTLSNPREELNLSQTFQIPTTYNGNELFAGSTSMIIYQPTIKNNYSTKVMTEYGHKYLGINSAGFSAGISGSGPNASVSISIGMAYSRSGQAKETIMT